MYHYINLEVSLNFHTYYIALSFYDGIKKEIIDPKTITHSSWEGGDIGLYILLVPKALHVMISQSRS